MSTLIFFEHTNDAISPSSLHAVTAATQIGGDVVALIAGSGCDGAAQAAAKVEGVSKVVGFDIPERDYPSITTLDDFAGYLAGRTG